MKTRTQIKEQYAKNVAEMARLAAENLELTREGYLLSDEEQWFTEQEEEFKHWSNIGVNDKGKPQKKLIKEMRLVGRVHWMEDFKDQSTGEIITIERSRVVRIGGSWD